MNNIKYIYTDNLIELIYKYADDQNSISVVSDLDTIWDTAIELNNEQYFDPSLIDIDNESYTHEYILSIDFNNHYFNIEKAFNEDSGRYIGAPGIVLIEDTVNSKYVIDVGKYINDFNPVFFTFDQDLASDEDEPTTVTKSVSTSFEWDKDRKGFIYSYVDDGCVRRFAYRSNHELTEDEAKNMLQYYKNL